MSLNPKSSIDEIQLLEELRATFPGLMVRPLREYGASDVLGTVGAWVGADSAEMPDGLPIFTDLLTGEDEYDGFVHGGFLAWLERRGWYLECQDPFTHFAIPVPVIAASVRALHHAWFPYVPKPFDPLDLPF